MIDFWERSRRKTYIPHVGSVPSKHFFDDFLKNPVVFDLPNEFFSMPTSELLRSDALQTLFRARSTMKMKVQVFSETTAGAPHAPFDRSPSFPPFLETSSRPAGGLWNPGGGLEPDPDHGRISQKDVSLLGGTRIFRVLLQVTTT